MEIILVAVAAAVLGGTVWARSTLRAHHGLLEEAQHRERFEPIAQDAAGTVEGVLDDGRSVLVRGYDSPNLAPWRTERLPDGRWGLAAKDGEEWWCAITDDTLDPVLAARHHWEQGAS